VPATVDPLTGHDIPVRHQNAAYIIGVVYVQCRHFVAVERYNMLDFNSLVYAVNAYDYLVIIN